MTTGMEDGAMRDDKAPSSPSPSRQVDLEARLLAAQLAEVDTRPNEVSSIRAWIVMVISTDPETRYYVRECLRARESIRVVEVALPANAALIASHLRPDLIIADDDTSAELVVAPVIMLADDQPRAVSWSEQQQRQRMWLARPFNAASLLALVDQMLRARPP